MPSSDYDHSIYARPGLKCRFSYFKYWRQYEHAHTLCWLGKDLSWNQYNPYFWAICTLPTLVIAADFMWVTFRTKCMMEDTMHYLAQFIWVIGNMMWAIGNVFVTDFDDSDDSAMNMFIMDAAARARLRNWGSWMLFVAYWPLIILYLVWIPLTYYNAFEDRASVLHFRRQQFHSVRATEIAVDNSHRPSEAGKASFFFGRPTKSVQQERPQITESPFSHV